MVLYIKLPISWKSPQSMLCFQDQKKLSSYHSKLAQNKLEAISISEDMNFSMFAYGLDQLPIDNHLSFLEQRTASIWLSYCYFKYKALPYVEQQVVACNDLSQCTDHHNSVYKDSQSEDQTSDLTTSFVTVYLCISKSFEYPIFNHKPSK